MFEAGLYHIESMNASRGSMIADRNVNSSDLKNSRYELGRAKTNRHKTINTTNYSNYIIPE